MTIELTQELIDSNPILDELGYTLGQTIEISERLLPLFLYEVTATTENIEQFRTIAQLGQLVAQIGQTIYISSEHPNRPPRHL